MKKNSPKPALKNQFNYFFYLMKKLLIIILFFLISIIKLNAQWEECNNGLNGYNIACFIVDGNNTYTGMEGGVFMTTDNGDNWIAKNNGLKGLIGLDIQSFAISDNNIFAGTPWDGIFFSTDKGENWVRKSNGLPYKFEGQDTMFMAPIRKIIIIENNIFAGTNGVFKSTDNGGNWTLKNNGITQYTHITSMAVSGNNIFAGSDKGIYLSTDYGDNWFSKNKGLTNLEVYSIVINGNNIFAGSRRGIFLSTDNGNNWNFNGIKDTLMNTFAIIGNYIFAGGYGIYLTSNNGTNWTKHNSGLKTLSISSIIIHDDYIFAGTDESGIFRAKLSDLGITDVEENKLTLANIIYPNPASDFVKIRMKEQPSGNVHIRIVDLFGRTVYNSIEINSEQFNEKTIDCSSFPNGFYSAILTYNNKNEWLPFVISK